jgi:hypothetical protein
VIPLYRWLARHAPPVVAYAVSAIIGVTLGVALGLLLIDFALVAVLLVRKLESMP